MNDDAGVALLRAVARWVEAAGGTAVVAAGISVAQRDESRYEVRIAVTGTPPELKGGRGDE